MEEQFSELVSKILSGEASEEDRKEFSRILSDNPDYNFKYNQLKEYWNADVEHKLIRDREQITDKIMERIKDAEGVTKVRKGSLKIAMAAAVLFFVTTCAWIYYKNYIFSSGNIYTYAAQTVPVEYTLSDGSKVTLNKNSSITLAADFGDEFRDVKLDGEAYFVVSKDKSRPFSVETNGTKTKVLGTSFNVKSKDNEVITTLVEGSIMFTSNNFEKVLRPNDELRYNVTTSMYEKYVCDVQLNTAWVSGRFNYSGISFGAFVNKLEAIYNKKIHIKDSKLANHIVSASFLVEEPIEDILDALKVELKFNYVVDNANQIRIVSK